jgi:hypothetical protein
MRIIFITYNAQSIYEMLNDCMGTYLYTFDFCTEFICFLVRLETDKEVDDNFGFLL